MLIALKSCLRAPPTDTLTGPSAVPPEALVLLEVARLNEKQQNASSMVDQISRRLRVRVVSTSSSRSSRSCRAAALAGLYKLSIS